MTKEQIIKECESHPDCSTCPIDGNDVCYNFCNTYHTTPYFLANKTNLSSENIEKERK